jgi:hypothetical protein
MAEAEITDPPINPTPAPFVVEMSVEIVSYIWKALHGNARRGPEGGLPAGELCGSPRVILTQTKSPSGLLLRPAPNWSMASSAYPFSAINFT